MRFSDELTDQNGERSENDKNVVLYGPNKSSRLRPRLPSILTEIFQKEVDKMVENDYWSRSQNEYLAIHKNREDIFREMEHLMVSELGDISENVSEDLVRERTIPSATK